METPVVTYTQQKQIPFDSGTCHLLFKLEGISSFFSYFMLNKSRFCFSFQIFHVEKIILKRACYWRLTRWAFLPLYTQRKEVGLFYFSCGLRQTLVLNKVNKQV